MSLHYYNEMDLNVESRCKILHHPVVSWRPLQVFVIIQNVLKLVMFIICIGILDYVF